MTNHDQIDMGLLFVHQLVDVVCTFTININDDVQKVKTFITIRINLRLSLNYFP